MERVSAKDSPSTKAYEVRGRGWVCVDRWHLIGVIAEMPDSKDSKMISDAVRRVAWAEDDDRKTIDLDTFTDGDLFGVGMSIITEMEVLGKERGLLPDSRQPMDASLAASG